MPRSDLIAARVAEPVRTFASRLAERAQAMGEARAAARALARRHAPDRRWRDARLLWPLFTRAVTRTR